MEKYYDLKIELEDNEIKKIDNFVKLGLCKSRKAFILRAINDQIDELENKNK